MNRRELLGRTSVVGISLLAAGCLDDGTDDTDSSADSTGTGPTDRNSVDTRTTDDETTDDEECRTEVETKTENVVSNSERIAGGYQWTHEYRIENGDTVDFDISASAGQDVEVEIDSPRGQTVYSESGLSLNTVHRFTTGGSGKVRVKNLGERTEEEREELWNDRVDIGAGGKLNPWAEIEEGNHVDYYIRKVDGARPILRIEDEYGTVMRDHAVSAVIDDTFTAPEDGRYYFVMENTAMITSGTWDYEFERVNETPVTTRVDLTVEREFEEEREVCE